MTLFDPLALGELTIRNRIMMSPMSQRAAGEDGRATDWHLVHYGSRAVGGCGLVMVEDTAVAPAGRTSHAALGLYEQEQAESLSRTVAFCHAHGAAVGLQLAHAGRKALADTRGAPAIISASPLAYGPGWAPPLEVGHGDLAGVVRAFAAAAHLALEAGFDVVEVHAAHGYLLHQFLSPLTNFRDDAYGVNDAGRRRLLLEVVRAVRAVWPGGRPLFVRLPAGDGQPGGLQVEQVAVLARACALAGADLVDITGGTPLLEGKRASNADVLALAGALASDPPEPRRDVGPEPRRDVGPEPRRDVVSLAAGSPGWPAIAPGCPKLAAAIGGGVLDGASAEALLRDRGATLVSVGRPLLSDPYWPMRAARDLGVAPPLPLAYRDALGGDECGFPLSFGGAVSSPDHSKQVDDHTNV